MTKPKDALTTVLNTALDQMTEQELKDPKNRSLLFLGVAVAEWLESPNPGNVPDRLMKEIASILRDIENRPVPKTVQNRVALMMDGIEAFGGTREGEGEGRAFNRYVRFRRKLDARLNAPYVPEVETEQ